MRRALTLVAALLSVGGLAGAACPPDCVPGGGPAASDCLVQYGGINATTVTCTDGNPGCDSDGLIDGACRFDLTVCVGSAAPGCTPAALTAVPKVAPASSPAARALAAALAPLVGQTAGCVSVPLVVPLRTSLAGVSAALLRLTVAARAGTRRDRDRLKLTCLPAATAPSFAAAIQPVFTERCAVPACHQGGPATIQPVLDSGLAYGAVVNVPSLNVPGLGLVVPGNVASSYLARKILHKRIVDHTSGMPLGCPATPPLTGCLTPAETAAIIDWIQGGAPQ